MVNENEGITPESGAQPLQVPLSIRVPRSWRDNFTGYCRRNGGVAQAAIIMQAVDQFMDAHQSVFEPKGTDADLPEGEQP